MHIKGLLKVTQEINCHLNQTDQRFLKGKNDLSKIALLYDPRMERAEISDPMSAKSKINNCYWEDCYLVAYYQVGKNKSVTAQQIRRAVEKAIKETEPIYYYPYPMTSKVIPTKVKPTTIIVVDFTQKRRRHSKKDWSPSL